MVKLVIEPLQKTRHSRTQFDCGLTPVNDFLKKAARRQMDLRVNHTWVAVAQTEEAAPVLAFFTLTQCTVSRTELPSDLPVTQWPRYPLPVLKLAWLGVHKTHQRTAQRMGELMLVDAINRSTAMVRSTGLGIALLVDPLPEQSEHFFLKYGFQAMQRAFRERATLFLPLRQA